MPFSLVPRTVLGSIYDLTPERLQAWGIRLVLADLDNTLTAYEEGSPSPALHQWKQSLEEAGITLFVVSNSRKSHRCPNFCTQLGIEYVRHAGKPQKKGFQEALARTGFSPRETLMVGDQIFTDILGANRSGIRSVLVHPIAWGKNPGRILRYAAETPFRLLGKARGLEG